MTVYPRELCSRLAPFGALLAALVLAGCGVKGGLEPPPGSTPPATQTTADTPAQRTVGPKPVSTSPGLRRALQDGPRPDRPDEPFALDPLL